MSKYIDADAIIDRMNNMKVEGETFLTAVEFVKSIVNNTPTADVRENVRGEWRFPYETTTMICECSVCGSRWGKQNYNFCPNCGCSIVKENDDERN